MSRYNGTDWNVLVKPYPCIPHYGRISKEKFDVYSDGFQKFRSPLEFSETLNGTSIRPGLNYLITSAIHHHTHDHLVFRYRLSSKKSDMGFKKQRTIALLTSCRIKRTLIQEGLYM